MTRGRHHNHAYIVTNGEQTALDLFAEAVTRNWIDRPAHARQAELTDTNPRRPGTLPTHELQTLYDHKAHLQATLEQLHTDLTELPRQQRWTIHELDEATSQLADHRTRLHAAHDTIAQHDRPLRRRGHENVIAAAHRDLATTPEQIRSQDARVDHLRNKIHNIDRQLHQAEQLDRQRPALETQLTDIDGLLGDDRRIRTRQIQRDPPERITQTLGPRPEGGQPARAWDHAAGQLDQHHTTHNLAHGLGTTTEPGHTTGYQLSRILTQHAIKDLGHTIAREHQPSRQMEGPGISL